MPPLGEIRRGLFNIFISSISRYINIIMGGK